MNEGVPIILFSGMAADERLFESQSAIFANLRVQPWQSPLPDESLRAYAARLSLLANPGRPCIVGGASFGGVVALEVAQFLPAVACVLIGSVRSPLGLPWRWRLLQPIAWFGPSVVQFLAVMITWFCWPFMTNGTLRKFKRLARPEAAFIRWAICALVKWRPSHAIKRVPVFHIHGSDDKVLPIELAHPDVIVPAGSHALSVFSPSAVNNFLADVLQKVSGGQELDNRG